MKRTCFGCKALEITNKDKCGFQKIICKLYYGIEILSGMIKPLYDCPKPKTIKKFNELKRRLTQYIEDMENHK